MARLLAEVEVPQGALKLKDKLIISQVTTEA